MLKNAKKNTYLIPLTKLYFVLEKLYTLNNKKNAESYTILARME